MKLTLSFVKPVRFCNFFEFYVNHLNMMVGKRKSRKVKLLGVCSVTKLNPFSGFLKMESMLKGEMFFFFFLGRLLCLTH